MTGTVSKRPLQCGEIRWAYSFFAGWLEKDGNRVRDQRTKSGFKTKREAQDALRLAIAERRGKVDAKPTPCDITFAAWMERWLTEFAARTSSPKTLQSMREQSQYLVRELGASNLRDLTPLQVESALHRIQDHGGRPTKVYPHGRPLAPKTTRHVAFVLLKCLRKAVGLELITRVPISEDYKPPKLEQKDPPALDRGVIDRLLEHASGSRFFPLLVLAAATGCRRGELLALLWSDVDFETGVVSVSKSLEETDGGLRVKSTKSGKPRRFAVPQQALAALEEHRCEQDKHRSLFGSDYEENDLVFCHPDGRYLKPDKVSVRVTKIARKAGLPGIGLHSLRHSHASELLSNGTPLPTVAKRLGHKNANVTAMIYAHALEADELAAAQVWDDAMAGVISKNRKKREDSRMLAYVSVEHSEKVVSLEKRLA